MTDKERRLKLIRKMVRTECVRSQDFLLERLEQEGLSVTQATLSRDMKILEVAKVADGKNGYYYTLPEDSNRLDYRTGFIKDLQRGLMSIAWSAQMAVIRTRVGQASSVALAMDNLEIEGILGTIAGDDTVMLVASESGSRDAITGQLLKFAPDMIS